MSVAASIIIEEAAVLLGDPQFTQVSRERWRVLLNRAQRKMATRIDAYGLQVTFAITDGVSRIALPDDCTHLARVEFTETPSDPRTYRKLDDLVEEEWSARVNGNYPAGPPNSYCCRLGWLHLVPEPETTIADGGRMDYWALPPDVTDIDTQSIAFPDMARDHLVTGCLIEGMRSIRMYTEANALEREWYEIMEPEVKDRLEDRSSDRRPSLRPVTSRATARPA